MTNLLDQVWTMLNRTLEVYRDSPQATEWLRRHAELLDGPLRIAVVGQRSAGKSTLVNALVGELVAPLDPTDELRAPAWYRAGATPRAIVHPGGSATAADQAETFPPALTDPAGGTPQAYADPGGRASRASGGPAGGSPQAFADPAGGSPQAHGDPGGRTSQAYGDPGGGTSRASGGPGGGLGRADADSGAENPWAGVDRGGEAPRGVVEPGAAFSHGGDPGGGIPWGAGDPGRGLDPHAELPWAGAGASRAAADPAGIEVPASRHGGRLQLDLREWRGHPLDRIVVDWPSRGLKGMTLIDTPSVSASEPSTVDRFEADAVLYLAQHLQATDIRLLQSLHEHPIAMANPVATVLVLSRADELGASQIDALFAAKQVARQHRRDPRTRSLCQDVVSVTGLLGYAGKTLHQHEFDALATVAFAARSSLDGYLLSADRFAGPDFPLPLPVEARRALLDRLGLFGVRLCTTLIRQGYNSHTELCAQLVQRSGLTELRESIGRYFTDRADVLKARSALLALSAVLRMEPRPAAIGLVAALERALAGAHELRELRLLATLHAGYPALPAELQAEARQLIGGDGLSLAARLGLPDDPTTTGLRHAIIDALRRWREQTENPILDRASRDAATIVVRTCEDMLANLTAVGGGRG